VIEAELKARVRDPDRVRALLGKRAREGVSTYADVYFDRPDHELSRDDRELRVRTIKSATDERSVVTYKDAAVDAASGSKPEYEIEVSDPAAAREMLGRLGFIELIAFEKHCADFAFEANGYRMQATLVTVSQVDGTFLEVETLVAEDGLLSALRAVRALVSDLGVSEADLTTELYTDLVAAARSSATT
jgi:adenylate cyclase class 2